MTKQGREAAERTPFSIDYLVEHIAKRIPNKMTFSIEKKNDTAKIYLELPEEGIAYEVPLEDLEDGLEALSH